MSQVVLHIEGMSCGHCLQGVRRALTGLSGVTIGQITMGRAELEVASDGPSPEVIASTVTEAGYPTTPSSVG